MTFTKQKGVGLVEALVAGLVFAVGIAAVLQLQGLFFKNSSSANSRSAAMSIAQEKLEDLRGFQKVDSSDTTIFDFTSIGTNTGGRLTNPLSATGFSSGIPQKNLAVGNTAFSRNWSVTDYYYNNAGALTTPVPTGTIPDQKKVVITVTWTDAGDTTDQTLSLEGLINNTGPSATSAIAKNSGGSGEKPKVYYTPSSDANVVSVGVGTNTKRETLVPTESGNQVKFTAYTYTSSGELLRQEDFLTVSCNCAFTTSGQARTAARAIWEDGTYKDQDGDLVNKDKGCVTNGNNSNCLANPEELCSSCCSDHHDPGASAVDSSNNKYCSPTDNILDRCFDPFRGSGDFTNGKHKHYTNAGVEASSGQYLESCRMKRINGYWRVYQDWHRVEISAFPLSELALVSGQTSTSETSYANYVKAIVDAVLDDNTITKFNGQSFTLPTSKPAATNRTSTNPVSVAVDGQQELTARAVFIDYLNNDVLTKIREQKTANADYLIHVPFYEVDVTDRGPNCNDSSDVGYGGWCSPDVNKVLVGAGDIADHNGNGLASGIIKGVSSTSSSPINIKYSMRRSNSGLMGLSEPVDRSSDSTIVNRDILRSQLSTSTTSPRDIALVAVSVTTGAVSTTHTLSVTLTGGTPSTGSLAIQPDSGTANCNGSANSYTCSVPNSAGGQLHFTGTSSNGEQCEGTGNYPASTTNQSISLTITCQPASSTHALTITLSPSAGTLFGSGTFISTQATACSGVSDTYTCNESNTATGNADWTYSGRTTLGGICSGSGSYATGTATRGITLNVSCITTRQMTACLTGNAFDSGTLSVTPSGGTTTACDTPKADAATCGNSNKSSICTVPIGIGGALSFSGTKVQGSNTRTCLASGSYSTGDIPPSLTVSCN